ASWLSPAPAQRPTSPNSPEPERELQPPEPSEQQQQQQQQQTQQQQQQPQEQEQQQQGFTVVAASAAQEEELFNRIAKSLQHALAELPLFPSAELPLVPSEEEVTASHRMERDPSEHQGFVVPPIDIQPQQQPQQEQEEEQQQQEQEEEQEQQQQQEQLAQASNAQAAGTGQQGLISQPMDCAAHSQRDLSPENTLAATAPEAVQPSLAEHAAEEAAADAGPDAAAEIVQRQQPQQQQQQQQQILGSSRNRGNRTPTASPVRRASDRADPDLQPRTLPPPRAAGQATGGPARFRVAGCRQEVQCSPPVSARRGLELLDAEPGRRREPATVEPCTTEALTATSK
ncbi:unnamed protein product, partial [Polarella glacialis]